MTFRRSEWRWVLASVFLHAALFVTLPDRVVDFIGRANSRAIVRAAQQASRAPARSWTPIQVVDIDELGDPVDVPAVPPTTRLSPQDILDRIQTDIEQGVEDPSTPGLSPALGGANGRFTPPVPLGFRWPDYPEDAGGAGPQRVVVRILVDVAGAVTDVDVSDAAPEPLRRAAREWALGTRWRPARRDGVPTSAWFTLAIRFSP